MKREELYSPRLQNWILYWNNERKNAGAGSQPLCPTGLQIRSLNTRGKEVFPFLFLPYSISQWPTSIGSLHFPLAFPFCSSIPISLALLLTANRFSSLRSTRAHGSFVGSCSDFYLFHLFPFT